MTVRERIQQLLRKHHAGTITASETEEMFGLMAAHEPLFRQEMTALFMEPDNDSESSYDRQQWQYLLNRVESRTGIAHRVRKMYPWKWVAAASVILVLSATAYWGLKENSPAAPVAIVKTPDPIYPGTDKATLTLADGRRIELAGQQVITDGKLEIRNENNGLVYTKNSVVAMNTMQTPYGGQYRLQLADGTKVWLNAGSSITYPTAFSGKQRVVDITGEAYFEVATDKSKPFIVHAGNESVEILGTDFNINAYTNEPAMQTTLLKGALRIKNKVLKPGEAWIDGKIKKANQSQVLAWKNGLFNFDGARFEELMRQFERWYDIRVVYETNVRSNIIFKGEMYRSVQFSDVLDFLKRMGVNCQMEGKTLIVH